MGVTMIATKNDLKTKKGIIYVIKNKINWKRYIGQSKHTFHYRYGSGKWWEETSNCYLKHSIEKYGKENFEIEVLLENLSQKELNYWEKFYIDYFKTCDSKYGYNLKEGGIKGGFNKETKFKMSLLKLMSLKEYLKRAKKIHGNKYDYSLVKIEPYTRKIKIFCKKCNQYFIIHKTYHLIGKGCQKCGIAEARKPMTRTFKEFICLVNKKFKHEYKYNKEEYKNCRSFLNIKHKICGTVFFMSVRKHIESKHGGCPKCRKNKCGKRQKVCKIDMNTNKKLEIFDSLGLAGKSVGKTAQAIRAACKFGYKTNGFKWKYCNKIS